ncbi:MAG: hypothetical protein UU11_C0002G0106 [Parcubacteria group bacterium GW2011_GWF2_40_69]|nr:MAG: hypothetical protein UT25_C0002G0185 [Parcubacteria group bacterium GW2011_GWC1_39_12]KKR19315.1 MAG: hypothetical protein UT49_C0002G0161 [Parcubacteria group bacterium GW2011_GWF1_39_37]KKR35302.1 MAG: hypothetical protein UT68_C0004G0110 [Parcubacteria group bacterium GW2011_GWC2_40_10]KKR52266.1 MAG: hypothetical protein UT89_C0002G0067 [Parcubacteria group bacterium GW2011_GWE1_40_20]KKR69308.1 MAG: hypothetical protein UU11_C0002G0106 [Parcubacteria group bacterium GW2011_GWF2_40_
MQKIKQAGFTLVETLVAISILTLSIVATFTAVQNGIQNSTIAKDQTTAFYLAQEAMEFIKNKRDENALKSISGETNNWLTKLSFEPNDPCYFGRACRVDLTANNNDEIVYCGSNNFSDCPVLNQNTVTSLFGYSSDADWEPSIFKRGIKFREISSGTEVEVTIEMSWTSRWGTKSFQVTEILLNRQ